MAVCVDYRSYLSLSRGSNTSAASDCLPPYAWHSSLWFQHHSTNVYHMDVLRAFTINMNFNTHSRSIFYTPSMIMMLAISLWRRGVLQSAFRSALEIVAVMNASENAHASRIAVLPIGHSRAR